MVTVVESGVCNEYLSMRTGSWSHKYPIRSKWEVSCLLPAEFDTIMDSGFVYSVAECIHENKSLNSKILIILGDKKGFVIT